MCVCVCYVLSYCSKFMYEYLIVKPVFTKLLKGPESCSILRHAGSYANVPIAIHLALLGDPRVSECFQECLTRCSPKRVLPFSKNRVLLEGLNSPADHPRVDFTELGHKH